MSLNKNFLRKNPDFFRMSRYKLIVGIFLGLFYAFSFYSFLYLTRELFRVLSVTETYDLWILTDKEVHFYNLIFAYFSVILGQSVTFSFCFDQPKRKLEKQSYRKTSILNDQRVLNWFFLSWFSKLALAFGIFFALSFQGGFYVFSLYPDYNYIFILIVVVLFLQSWNTVNFHFGKKGQKLMLISGVILSIAAFSFSRINLIDYNAINKYFSQKSIRHDNKLELPETNNYKILNNRNLVKNIYIVEPKSLQYNHEPVIIVENEIIELSDLSKKVKEWQSISLFHEFHLLTYRLNIHKSIKMSFINQMKNELVKLNVYRIAYAVIPQNRDFEKQYYQNCSFPMILPPSGDYSMHQNIYRNLEKTHNVIDIKQSISENFINDILVANNQTTKKIKQSIKENSNYILKFHINDNITFSDYLRILTSHKNAVDELRNEYSRKLYLKSFENLNYVEEDLVREKYPYRILEVTEEMNKID